MIDALPKLLLSIALSSIGEVARQKRRGDSNRVSMAHLLLPP
jgi:hypothetical protein